MQEFARIIKERRAELGLSVREAAERIGITHTWLVEVERGRSYRTDNPARPSRELVRKLAIAYELPGDLLLSLAGYPADEASTLPLEQREVLLYFEAIPASRRELAMDMLRLFARPETTSAKEEDGP